MNNNDYVENVENKKEKIFDRINIAPLQSIFKNYISNTNVKYQINY